MDPKGIFTTASDSDFVSLSEEDMKDMIKSIPKPKSLILTPEIDGFAMYVVDTKTLKAAIALVSNSVEPFKWVPKKLKKKENNA